MNNKRLNLAQLTKFGKPQLKHVPNGASALAEPVAVSAPMGMECLAVQNMPVNATC
jgi:hypothetical protein